jgi:hypothetical protein
MSPSSASVCPLRPPTAVACAVKRILTAMVFLYLYLTGLYPTRLTDARFPPRPLIAVGRVRGGPRGQHPDRSGDSGQHAEARRQGERRQYHQSRYERHRIVRAYAPMRAPILRRSSRSRPPHQQHGRSRPQPASA